MIIQKLYIIDILHQLIVNSLLYKYIKINYYLLNTYDNKLIFSNIVNNIINYNFNYNKYLDYLADIYKNNHENNFYTIIINKKIEKDHIYSSCIYSDINNKK